MDLENHILGQSVCFFFFFLDNFEKMCLCILTGNCLHLFVACDSVYVVSKNIFYAALLANSL